MLSTTHGQLLVLELEQNARARRHERTASWGVLPRRLARRDDEVAARPRRHRRRAVPATTTGHGTA